MVERTDLIGPFPEGVDHDEYDRRRRRVLWQLPMGLYLLGSSARGEKNLMTLNWVTQVSTRPKQLAVSVEKTALTHELVSKGGCFALSVISREDRGVVRKFVKPAVHDENERTLNHTSYETALTGAPFLAQALGWLDCKVRQVVDAGSHSVFIGEVVDAGGEGAGEAEVLRMEDTRMSYGG